MDRFFIGQRVRILLHPWHVELDGRAGRIVGRIAVVRRRGQPVGSDSHWLVAPEDIDGTPPARTSRAVAVAATQLEPLPPEGMVAVEWIDCAWQPEQVLIPVEVPRSTAQQRALRALARRSER
jgi:hypothetical protein